MKLCLLSVVFALSCGLPCALPALGQQLGQHQPPGVAEALEGLASTPAMKTSFALDRDTLDAFLGADTLPPAALTSINFERFSFHEPAFYTPENMHALNAAYERAGWHHLVDANAGARQSAAPDKPITDLWLHFQGTDVDHVTVLIRASKQMNLIEVTGMLRPLDLVHLSGHFGIPKVDPGAVMVPAPAGK
jgi:hypothetical protein